MMRGRARHSPSPCLPLAHEVAMEAAQHRPTSLSHQTAAAITAEDRSRTGIASRSVLQQEGATSEIDTREEERRQGQSREGGEITDHPPSPRCRWPRPVEQYKLAAKREFAVQETAKKLKGFDEDAALHSFPWNSGKGPEYHVVSEGMHSTEARLLRPICECRCTQRLTCL